MKKGNLLKTMLTGMLVLNMIPVGNVKATNGSGYEEVCYFQGKVNSGKYSFNCPGYGEGLTVRVKAIQNVTITSSNILYIGEENFEVSVGKSINDSTKNASFLIEIYDTNNSKIGSQEITIDGYTPEEPEEPEEPDVPDTPMGNVFVITEGTQIPSMKVDEETVIEIPITRNERVGKNEAQVSVKLPEGLYFTEIANIQNVEFERKNDYESSVQFKVMANPKVESGVYPINLTVKYKYDGQNKEDNLEFYVKVIGKDEAEVEEGVKGKPRIIIDSYSFGGSQVMGGMPFTLAMSYKNTSAEVDIKNLKITIQSASDEDTGGVFTPTASSNSFFVDNLGRNTSVTKSIVLMPRADAKPKSYGVDITFEYEAMMNGELKEFSSTERISIPVIQSDRFEIGEVTTWGDFYVGESSDIMVNYVNKGKTTINNLEITVESEMLDIPEKTTYVGNVESGNSDSFSTSVSALTEGDITGTVTFKYEDSNGSQVEVVREFKGTAINMWVDPGIDEPVDPNMPLEPETPKTPWWQWAIVLVTVALVLGGGFVFYKKKKQAQKEKEDATFDDFDEA